MRGLLAVLCRLPCLFRRSSPCRTIVLLEADEHSSRTFGSPSFVWTDSKIEDVFAPSLCGTLWLDSLGAMPVKRIPILQEVVLSQPGVSEVQTDNAPTLDVWCYCI